MRTGLLALGLAAACVAYPASAQNDPKSLETRFSAEYGPYLTDETGRAVYLFTADRQGQGQEKAESQCRDACATAWPPFTVGAAPQASKEVKPDLIATIERPSGETQATYNGWPLYSWVADEGKGETTGHGAKQFGGQWYLVTPEGEPATPRKPKTAKGAVPSPSDIFGAIGFRGPECVRHDVARDRYLVTNINGGMREADDNGYISWLNPDGSVAQMHWIAGGRDGVVLNAPKGMAVTERELHVADIDHLRTFDAETGAPVRSIEIEGALFLNDIALAEDGTIYVTDTGTADAPGAIYRVSPDGQVKAIAKGRDLDRPNGVDLDKDGNLVVVTFSADKVLTVSPDGKILNTRKLGTGKLDGLVVRPDGSALVASWDGKHVVRLSPDGSATPVLTDVRTPACFDVDEERQRLLVPLVREGRLVVAPLG